MNGGKGVVSLFSCPVITDLKEMSGKNGGYITFTIGVGKCYYPVNIFEKLPGDIPNPLFNRAKNMKLRPGKVINMTATMESYIDDVVPAKVWKPMIEVLKKLNISDPALQAYAEMGNPDMPPGVTKTSFKPLTLDYAIPESEYSYQKEKTQALKEAREKSEKPVDEVLTLGGKFGED